MIIKDWMLWSYTGFLAGIAFASALGTPVIPWGAQAAAMAAVGLVAIMMRYMTNEESPTTGWETAEE